MEKTDNKTSQKCVLLDKEWWYGILADIIATIIGIALTFGVTAYFDDKEQEQYVRQIMLSAIRTVETDRKAIEKLDSAYQKHCNACEVLTDLYVEHKGDLSLVSNDTIKKYLNIITNIKSQSKQGYTEQIFFDASVMHLFKNHEVYQRFAIILDADAKAFEITNTLKAQAKDIMRIVRNKKEIDGKPLYKVVEELIREYVIPNYRFAIKISGLRAKCKALEESHFQMLKLTEISEEEYRQYINNLELDNWQPTWHIDVSRTPK